MVLWVRLTLTLQDWQNPSNKVAQTLHINEWVISSVSKERWTLEYPPKRGGMSEAQPESTVH